MKKAKGKAKLWLNREMRPYRVSILSLTVLGSIATLSTLAFAYLVRYLINTAADGDKKLLCIFSAVALGLLLLKIFIRTFDSYYAEKLRSKMVSSLRTKTFSRVLRSEYAGLQGYHSGDVLNRLTSDINEVTVDTVGFLPTVTGMILQCVGAVVALLTIDPLFTCIYVVCGLIFGGLATLFRKRIKKCHKEVMEADSAFRAFMQESLGATMTLKAYGAEGRVEEKTAQIATEYYEKRKQRNILRAIMSGLFSLLSNFGLIFAIVWCSFSVLKGNNDFGSILSVILLLMQFQQPLTAFSSVLPVYYARLASAERILELEEIPKEDLISQDDNAADYENLQEIVFENIDFSYGREIIFEDASVRFKKKEIICLTGMSGAGKSTIFKLLMSIYKPNKGGILLLGTFDGAEKIPLNETSRALFAYVPQGNFLFSGTIYENIKFFAEEQKEDKLLQKIKQALSAACADFVWELPDGLQTSLNEGGAGLSEGQLQRLAVARALLSERPILLLDEATSALDADTEKTLLENIKNFTDKTCLIVTHRPAALHIADRIITIENGKIRAK